MACSASGYQASRQASWHMHPCTGQRARHARACGGRDRGRVNVSMVRFGRVYVCGLCLFLLHSTQPLQQDLCRRAPGLPSSLHPAVQHAATQLTAPRCLHASNLQRVQQDEAELRRLQQDLERTASDRSGLATELEALKVGTGRALQGQLRLLWVRMWVQTWTCVRVRMWVRVKLWSLLAGVDVGGWVGKSGAPAGAAAHAGMGVSAHNAGVFMWVWEWVCVFVPILVQTWGQYCWHQA